MTSIVPPGQLVYGMQLQVQAKSKTFVEEWEADAGADELRSIVQKADETGFFYVAVCDHLAVTKPLDAHMQTTWYDTVATLGWIAALTQQVRVMSHVYVMSYRHPLHTAKSFMTLDELSGGRAILGVGAGHLEGEFDLLGLDFPGRGAAPTRPSTRCVRRSPTSTPTSRRRSGGTCTTRAWRLVPASRRCRSGSAARRSRRCAGPPSAATGGCPRARRAPRCPTRSRSCSSTASGPWATSRSTWARSASSSTSVTPAGTSVSRPCPGPPIASSTRSTSSGRWASATSRSASATARSRSCSTRWTRSTATSHRTCER